MHSAQEEINPIKTEHLMEFHKTESQGCREPASPRQAGHPEAMLFSPRYSLRLNKLVLHFQPALTTSLLFFSKRYPIPRRPQRSPTAIQPETYLKRGRAWEWGRWGEQRTGCVAEECARGVRRQGRSSLSRHLTRLSPRVCGGVRFTFHLVADSQGVRLTHVLQNTWCYRRSHMGLSGGSASERDFRFFFNFTDRNLCFISSRVSSLQFWPSFLSIIITLCSQT